MSNQVIKRKFKLFVVEDVKWNLEDAFTHNIVVDIYGKTFMINVIFGNQTRLQLKVKLGFNILEGDACNCFDILLPTIFLYWLNFKQLQHEKEFCDKKLSIDIQCRYMHMNCTHTFMKIKLNPFIFKLHFYLFNIMLLELMVLKIYNTCIYSTQFRSYRVTARQNKINDDTIRPE